MPTHYPWMRRTFGGRVALYGTESGAGWSGDRVRILDVVQRAAHCAAVPDSGWLAMELWKSRWSSQSWRAFLEVKESASELAAIRMSTHTGRRGTTEFVHALKRSTRRLLAPQKRGRRPRAIADPSQGVLSIGCLTNPFQRRSGPVSGSVSIQKLQKAAYPALWAMNPTVSGQWSVDV